MTMISTGGSQVVPDAMASGYQPDPSGYDELFAGAGRVREHGQKMFAQLVELGEFELRRRSDQAQRMIRENGTTYNAYGDPRETVRPWNLDLLPVVFSTSDWEQVSAGIEQRTQLLSAILLDVHGPQLLLQRGLLPAELLFTHPGFQRSFAGQRPPGNCFVNFSATNLIRHPDGTWAVAADRTDAPQGAGYALENRIVVSRLLPAVIHDCRVERLAGFFITMQEMLRGLAPQHRENPRIVLLSQGPRSPNYFEDAYLSRYLGYTLVEPGDLTVRSDRVMLKTLGGLLQVDVILRRLSDLYGDPLEIRSDPGKGVTGLLQAVRAGQVAVANPLGSSLLESPAFLPYLPRLCRELLGSELLLPSIPTWWCGDPESRQYVLENLDDLQIRSAFRSGRLPAIAIEDLEGLSRSELRAAIQKYSRHFIAQRQPEYSTAPVFGREGWQASRVALRAYAVLSAAGCSVMPGGLLRVASDPRKLDLSILAGEGSKDAWVLARGPVQEVSLLQAAGRGIELRRSGAELPSRVADNLFWLGRYVERADGGTRLLRTTVSRLASESGAVGLPELGKLLRCLAAQGQIEPGFAVDEIRRQLPEIERMLPAFALDSRQPNSILSILFSMHRLANLVRDRISIDSWRILHHIQQDLQPLMDQPRVDLADLLALLNRILIDLAAFSGLVADSTTRTQGWRFLEIGRRLERSVLIIENVRNTLVETSSHEPAVMEAVLEVADSIMTYRSRYLSNVQPAPVLDLLLTDETNPRSLVFQLATLAEHVEQLPRDDTQPLRRPEQRIAITALDAVRLVELEMLTESDRKGRRLRLDQMLEHVADQLPRLSDLISHRYLVHAGIPRQLAENVESRHGAMTRP
jgi:uncharacterized circularly permuted ATP-grasp superfamily protein/uncharacterized alpha-E superfamily protein